MSLVLILFVLGALLLLGGAVWLYLQAGDREYEADVKLRLRVTGADDAAIAQGSTAIRCCVASAICSGGRGPISVPRVCCVCCC